MTKAREDRRIGKVPLDPKRPVNTCWDIGKDDNTAIWFFQAHGHMDHLIDYYENNGEGVAFYARILRDKKDQRGWEYGNTTGRMTSTIPIGCYPAAIGSRTSPGT